MESNIDEGEQKVHTCFTRDSRALRNQLFPQRQTLGVTKLFIGFEQDEHDLEHIPKVEEPDDQHIELIDTSLNIERAL